MVKNLKITAKMLTGQVATVDGYLAIDGVLAKVWIEENYPELIGQPFDFNNIIEADLPIERRGEGNDWYYAASFACFKPLKETRRFWHKKFDEGLATQYIDFQGKRGAIETKSGRFKNYRMPLNIILVPEINWYVRGDKEEIERLLQKVKYIGKKASQGLGAVKEWIIEEIDEDLSWLRPIPDPNGDDYSAIRPPYWYIGNYRKVKWPDDERLGARNLYFAFSYRGISKA